MDERDELYAGREQSLAKHEILRRYLEVLALKVGRFRPGLTLNYIDGFAGPWESRADDLSDTSPGIALTHLCSARRELAASGIGMRVRAFFVAVDVVGAERLRELVSRFEDAEISVEVGPFEQAIDAARQFTRVGPSGFTFIFIDHTGWRGFGLRAIEPLLHEGRTEVLINFMTAFIIRFINTGDVRYESSFVELFGDVSYREAWRGLQGLDREDRIVEAYCDRIAKAGGYRHCVSAVILNPTQDRTHYHLVYATHSDEGLVAFREIERPVLRQQRDVRVGAKQRDRVERTKQPDLFAGPELIVRSYEDELRERYLARASGVLDGLLRQHASVLWDQLVLAALHVPMIVEKDVKDWLQVALRAGTVEVVGLAPREKVPKRGQGHQVRRLK